jgi:pimeloyl-ACP methyl ester carboxylesterase
MMNLLSSAAQVSVEVVDRAAHLPHMEVPHVVNGLIQEFVRSTTE